MRRKVYLSKIMNPYLNLLLEKEFMKKVKGGEQYLLLWSSSPSVVVGRNQNVWKEVNIPYIKEREILLVRRDSGGGTVYHDPDNLNFSFIQKGPSQIDENLKFICDSLALLGVKITKNERNDLLWKDFKVSGSSFRLSKGVFLHHGTLLIDSNLRDLSNSLKKMPLKVECRSVESVRSKVTNLKDQYSFLSRELVEKTLAHSFDPNQIIIERENIRDFLSLDYLNDDWEYHWFGRKKFNLELVKENQKLRCLIEGKTIREIEFNDQKTKFSESVFLTEESLLKNKNSIPQSFLGELVTFSAKKLSVEKPPQDNLL